MTKLKDIAERTGVSVNTVSLALRHSPRIPEETRERIHAAAMALDYTPNHAARALVSRRTMTIGLLLTDVTSPVLTQVAQSVELELKARGYVTLLAASNGDAEEEERALATFRARQVDGILVYPDDRRRLDPVRRLRQAGLPVVLLAGAPEDGVDLVCLDERAGARKAVRALIGAGHRRIGLIDGAQLRGNPEKWYGYADALAEAGIEADPDLVLDSEGNSPAHGYAAFARIMGLPDPPTALLAATDRLALGGLRWCLVAGVRVPADLAVIGYDNAEYGPFATPPLSSVDYPVAEIARRAVERVLALVEAEGALPPPEAVRLEPDLILRDSAPGG